MDRKGFIDENIQQMFREAADLNSRWIRCAETMLVVYSIDGLTSGTAISEYVIKPISENLQGASIQEMYDNALHGQIVNSVAKPCKDLKEVASFLVNGFCVVLFPQQGAIAFETKSGEKRSIGPPELENTAKGPKDAFVETIRTNTSLIRRHLRTSELRIYETQVGCKSTTNVAVIWLEGTTDRHLVDRMKRRLRELRPDGLVTPAAVEEYVTGSRKTAFPLIQYTQRTDHFCHGLLHGRIGLLVDGIPLAYLLPVDIGYLMDTPEDRSRDYVTASGVRVLRYAALLISLLLPAAYVAMTVYHWEWIPQPLAQIIREGRKGVPFSPVLEVIGLLIAFELLQESGVHLPQSIGQSVSIIGGIVVGTVGVEAGLISAIALICVSLAGVSGFVLPNRDMAGAIRVWRMIIVALATVLGLLGLLAGTVLLILHLMTLKSIGHPYIKPFEPRLLRRRMGSEADADGGSY